MKRSLIAFVFILATIWRPATNGIGQQKIVPSAAGQTNNPVQEREKQKQTLLKQVDQAQDSTIKLLNKKKTPAVVQPVRLIRIRPENKKVDTLFVKGTTIMTRDTIYEDMYYIVPDTTPAKRKKKNLLQRIFGSKKAV